MKNSSNKRTPKPAAAPQAAQVDLVYQCLETEMGGVEIYTTALTSVQRDDLRDEWEKYLKQTKRHVQLARELCEQLGLDPDRDTPGRQVVRCIGASLVTAMQLAKGAGDPSAAEIVAAECVTLAETKDHANWALIESLSKSTTGKDKHALTTASRSVEDEEDEHLYHSAGWCRELWKKRLGVPAVLPPPEERADVHMMEEAAQAKNNSERGARRTKPSTR